MNRLVVVVLLLAIASLASACSLFSSESKPPAGRPVPTMGPLPAGSCQSRLGGQVTNIKTLQAPADAVVEIAASGKTIKTKTDPSGLYGFAGLCAGQYTVSITPPGGKPIANVGQVNLDGGQSAKLDLKY